jgi:hypothetical protein
MDETSESSSESEYDKTLEIFTSNKKDKRKQVIKITTKSHNIAKDI